MTRRPDPKGAVTKNTRAQRSLQDPPKRIYDFLLSVSVAPFTDIMLCCHLWSRIYQKPLFYPLLHGQSMTSHSGSLQRMPVFAEPMSFPPHFNNEKKDESKQLERHSKLLACSGC